MDGCSDFGCTKLHINSQSKIYLSYIVFQSNNLCCCWPSSKKQLSLTVRADTHSDKYSLVAQLIKQYINILGLS
jgi:hypothetical protein